MGKKGGSAPKAPDPYKTAQAESQFNRLDTYNPGGGGLRYGYTDQNGNFVQGTAPKGAQAAQTYFETDYEKAIREAVEPASVGLVNRIVGDNIEGMPDAARVQDFGDVADRLFQNSYNRMQPSFDAENNRLLSNLQARGIPIGSEAFTKEYDQQQQRVNDALSNLAVQSEAAAGAEQSRQFGLDSAARSNSIAELVAAMTGQYTPSGMNPSGNASGVNFGQLASQKYQSDLANWQAQQNSQNATLGAIGSIGSAMLMKSDRRVKTDVVEVGKRGPLTVFGFRYIWDNPGTMRIGYMAQQVRKFFPDAVKRVGAWLEVDYAQLPEVEHA